MSLSDKGKGIIRLDELQRINAGSEIGEYVKIQPIRAEPALEVELTPNYKLFERENRFLRSLVAKLIDKPLLIGDLVEIEAPIVLGTYISNPMLEPLSFVIENIKPSNKVVRVTRNTKIIITYAEDNFNWVMKWKPEDLVKELIKPRDVRFKIAVDFKSLLKMKNKSQKE